MADVDTINIEVLDGVSEITVVTLDSSVSSINVDVLTDIDTVTVFEANPSIDVIEIEKNYHPVLEVDGEVGIITLSYTTTLSSVSASSGVYTYTVTHSLDKQLVSVMLYNSDNDMYLTDIKLVDANSLQIKSLTDISGYKVVVQR